MTDDYRGDYAQAVQQAIDGRVGFYPDFDQKRQEEIWRLLSTDRDRLLTFCRRHEITIGRLELRKTLKSPKPLYELVAVGQDAESVRQYLGPRARPALTGVRTTALAAATDTQTTPASSIAARPVGQQQEADHDADRRVAGLQHAEGARVEA